MERELRKALLRTTLSTKTLNKLVAYVWYDSSDADVTLDPMRGGLIECTVHEVVHFLYADDLKIWGTLQEAFVRTLEDEIMKYIEKKPERVIRWRRAIQRKLNKERE